MTVPLTRPCVGDLTFQVYGRPLHPELFDILARRTVRHEDYEVSVWITTAGHVISWASRDAHLTEVAAAAGQPLPEGRRLRQWRLRQGERRDAVPCSPRLRYLTSFHVEVLPFETFLLVNDEIHRDGSKRGLLHRFGPEKRFLPSPMGFITVEARPGCLFLTTFHTYPDECAVVKTQSLIERSC